MLAKGAARSTGAATPCTEWSIRDAVAHVVTGNWWLTSGQPPQVPGDIEDLIGAEALYSVLAAPRGLEQS